MYQEKGKLGRKKNTCYEKLRGAVLPREQLITKSTPSVLNVYIMSCYTEKRRKKWSGRGSDDESESHCSAEGQKNEEKRDKEKKTLRTE